MMSSRMVNVFTKVSHMLHNRIVREWGKIVQQFLRLLLLETELEFFFILGTNS